MARNRKSTEQNDNKESNAMSTMFQPIEDEATLADILSGARGRGDYKQVLAAFIQAGVRLAQIPLDAGAFEGKKAQTVKTGFENAKNSKEPPEGASEVRVIKKNDAIYLLNNAVAAA
jgi:hypothetical protein